MKKNQLYVLTTGGTIEKSYNEQDGTLDNRDFLVEKGLVKKLRLPHLTLKIKGLMNKDSLQMTDEDREYIYQSISHTSSEGLPIVILHGTDTMDKTAIYCHEKLKNLKVAIVFTGAMKPVGFEDSDALQNFTEALMAAQILAPGLYVSFHGSIFHVPNVRKNREKATFENIN